MKKIVKLKFILGIAIILVAAFLFIYFNKGAGGNLLENQGNNFDLPVNERANPENVRKDAVLSRNNYETQTSDALGVEVSVRPVNLSQGNSQWAFEISLDTHSVELNKDLVLISELVDDKEDIYRPLLWEGDTAGGHHRAGILKFKPVSPEPEFIELRIKSLVENEERIFRWEITE